jgi:cytochrome c-type biogenesis protein CcmE
MKTRHKKLAIIVAAVIGLTVAALFGLNAFRSNLVFFFSPTDVVQGKAPASKTFRLGGLVKAGSVQRGKDLDITFVVTDMQNSIRVHYNGILPDLFREGQGVITQGKLGDDSLFQATEVLAKHDENYMPPEVAASLKKAGAKPDGQVMDTSSAPEPK